MSGGGCSHWPEVEAANDGRFGAREVERVERHLVVCAECRQRRDRLAALREEARRHASAPVSELQRHRARAALLRVAAAGRERPVQHVTAAVLGVALAAAAVGVLVLTRQKPAASSRVAEAVAEVEAVDGARWTRTLEPARETLRLTEGALRVHVPHQRAGHRFVVALPDGELEVRGTRFVVEAHGGRTERVTVTEGLVALRVAHASEQLIAAGGRWQASEVCARPAAEPARADATVVATAVAAPEAERDPVRPSTRAPGPGHSAFARFAAGVAAMGRGDFRSAAADFEAFERRVPQDERADDAAWLRVVALRRAGDDAGALSAAEHYLRGYEHGAHRGEVASLLGRAAYLRGDCARVQSLASSEGRRAGTAELERLRGLCARDAGGR